MLCISATPMVFDIFHNISKIASNGMIMDAIDTTLSVVHPIDQTSAFVHQALEREALRNP